MQISQHSLAFPAIVHPLNSIQIFVLALAICDTSCRALDSFGPGSLPPKDERVWEHDGLEDRGDKR